MKFPSAAILAIGAICAFPASAFELAETEKTISITNESKTVLVYHKAEVPAPAGADPKFRRSGFIHPLCAPSGEPVTGIHPADHAHHVGLWGAWVNTKHGERKPDFWNLKKGTGRVRYKSTERAGAGKGAPSFAVIQEYVIEEEGSADTVVLEEKFSVTVRNFGVSYLIDFISVQTNVSKLPLELPAYRYGGPIAYRGPSLWDKTNSTVLTSEGKTRSDGHTSRARWCAFSGPVKGGKAGLAILCHPENHDAPQRVRIWPEDSHNGAVFFNYVPIQEKAWSLAPSKPVTFRYRLLVHDGSTDVAHLEDTWKAYAEK
jgi:hypothetical protein